MDLGPKSNDNDMKPKSNKELESISIAKVDQDPKSGSNPNFMLGLRAAKAQQPNYQSQYKSEQNPSNPADPKLVRPPPILIPHGLATASIRYGKVLTMIFSHTK